MCILKYRRGSQSVDCDPKVDSNYIFGKSHYVLGYSQSIFIIENI